MVFKRQVSD